MGRLVLADIAAQFAIHAGLLAIDRDPSAIIVGRN